MNNIGIYTFVEGYNWSNSTFDIREENIDGIDYFILKTGSFWGSGVISIGYKPKLISEIVPTRSKENRSYPLDILPFDVNCSSSEDYYINGNYHLLQDCEIDNFYNYFFKVIDFEKNGTKKWSSPEVSVEEMMKNLGDAKKEVENLGMNTESKFIIVQLETLSPNVLGYISTDHPSEKGNIIHLNNSKLFTANHMKNAIVHEYFHHAQKNTLINGTNIYSPKMTDNHKWIAEGTAVWFQDYLYDDLNDYINIFASQIKLKEFMKYGLESIDTMYEASMFWKLLSYRCNSFNHNITNFFSANFTNDPTTIKNVISVLETSSCNFDNYVGNDNDILANAMLYYQYATTLKNDISLLENDEIKENFDFQLAKNINKVDWNNLVDYIQDEEILGKSIIPKYGAYSFNLSPKDLHDINSSLLITAQTDNPLTIVGIHFDENDNNTVEDSDDSFYFTTEANKKITYEINKDDIKGGIFLTLLNPTDKEVNISELKITKSRFIVSDSNNTIIDTKHSLVWDNQDKDISRVWKDANNYCKNLTLDSYQKWSLPTLFELQSIVDPTSDNHTYEEFIKLNKMPYGYWNLYTFMGYNQFMPWLGLQEQASVFMYESNRVSEHSTSYEMSVICVQRM